MSALSCSSIRTERVLACPLCGSPDRNVLCYGLDRAYQASDQVFQFVRCRRCRGCYQSLRPIEDDVHKLYPDSYAPYQVANSAIPPLTGESPGAPAQVRSRLMRKSLGLLGCIAEKLNGALRAWTPDPLPAVLSLVYKPRAAGQTLLDFGCGSEHFLNQARTLGWNTLGVDFVESVVARVRAVGHAGFLITPQLWSAIPDGSLDLVRLNHVVEHLYDPQQTLTALKRKLKPGGLLHLATPNAASLTFALLRHRWFALEPRHIILYSPCTARRLLRRVGFRHVRTYQEVLTKDAARSIGFWLQDLGKATYQEALTMPHRPRLNQLLYAPARLAALLGVSDRFHAVARVG